MRSLMLIVTLLACAVSARAEVVYSQPHDGSGTVYQSSYMAPEDSDYDIHVWDNFTLPAAKAITEVRWRGGFQYGGIYTPTVADFIVAIYPSSIAGEPDILNPPIVEYQVGGNAGQTPVGVFGGTAMYDYHFTLPSAFQAAAGVKYWVYVLAAQFGVPEWGFARGTGGNGSHFRWLRGAHMYQSVPGDVVFSLIAMEAATCSITASAVPIAGGTIFGTGQYPIGTNAALVATSNAGFAFDKWTENGIQVSTSNPYTFPVTSDRTLVAHFVSAYTIATSAVPIYGGTAGGDGTFTNGSVVTVSATPNQGFTFVGWTEFGAIVSTDIDYSFAAVADRSLTATFENDALSETFNFDSGPVHTSLPVTLVEAGLTASISATGGGFSIQPANAMGFTPLGFEGLCVYPNSVFPADLIVQFSDPLTGFSIMYAPSELGCDDSARMRVTTYLDDALVSTNTTTAPIPGNYPTGILAIMTPTSFNRVVVHYDAPPPTCQDWGPIFLADNMIVTRAVQSTCPADCTHDGLVGIGDLLLVIGGWGSFGGDADVTSDGLVGIADLLAVIGAWGACP